jgi:enediyne biosynthesis protein E4
VLPDGLQLAPIFAFAPIPQDHPERFLAGGNFSGTIPYEGKYDALFPTLFSADQGKDPFAVASILPGLRGEIRDLKWLRSARYGAILVVAKNNDSLTFLTYHPRHER